jgi:hypothetical protein
VAAILDAAPAGLGEYDLLCRLRDCAGLPADFHVTLPTTLQLFRCHFMLFHVLYRLQADYARAEQAHLEIGPLKICLHPWREAGQDLAGADPLRSYYQDLSQLEATDEADVTELLADFWTRLARGDARQAALQTLGLEDPVDAATIRMRYRELVMTHHPDRGGDTARLQAINEAMALLGKRGSG